LKSKKRTPKFAEIWREIEETHGYEILNYIGEGTYGTVVSVKN